MSKGRNRDLIKKRNKRLCQRYHYWTEVRRLRFDDTLRLLSEEEFFITEERILYIIRKMYNIKDFSEAPTDVRKPKPAGRQLSLFT